MHKEILTLDAIKKDLTVISTLQRARKTEWRMLYIIPITAIALILGILARDVVLGILIFSTSIYQIVQFVKESKEFSKQKRMVLTAFRRREIAISVQKFSHIAEESVYEPWMHGKHSHEIKLIRVYYFESGASWRIPEIGTHYRWSKNFYLSTKGMEHLATKGSEFFFIRLQADQEVAYIYPCKLFELDEFLKHSFL